MPYQTKEYTQVILDTITRCPGWMPTEETQGGAVMALHTLATARLVEYKPSLHGYVVADSYCRGEIAGASKPIL